MTDRDPVEVASFDAEPILAVLERHGVEYVIGGGYAARMHSSARPTRDVDVAPATTVVNLERLAAALRELDARIRTDAVPQGLPFTASAESLVGQRMLNLQAGTASWTSPSARPRSRAVMTSWSGDPPGAKSARSESGWAALEDVIRSKETAARDKDIRALTELYRLAEIDQRRAALPDAAQALGCTNDLGQ